MNYYQRHIGDYVKDCGHLTLLEHGVYVRLLDVYYTREDGIPEDQAGRLIAANSPAERKALATVLREFFTLVDGLYRQKRCDEDIGKVLEKSRRASASAKHRWSDNERSADAMRSHTVGNALQSPVTNSHKPEATSHPDSDARDPRPKTGTEAGGRESGDGVEIVPRGTSHAAQILDGVAFFRANLKPIYPTQMFTEADEIIAGRAIETLVGDGLATCDLLVANVAAFAKQQQAIGKSGTQYVIKPGKFFAVLGDWRGPFKLPDSAPGAESRPGWVPDPDEERRAQERIANMRHPTAGNA